MSIYLWLGSLGIIAFIAGMVLSLYGTHDTPATSPTSTPSMEVRDVETIQMPSFSFVDQHRIRHSSTNWRGQIVVVNFWATWCPPCLNEIPMLNALQTQYQEREVRFVGIAIDEPEKIQEFLTEHTLNYPTMSIPALGLEIMRKAGNTAAGIPYTVFMDKQGRIVQQHVGELTRQKAIQLLEDTLRDNS